MVEVVQISETSVNSYRSTRRYNPEDKPSAVACCYLLVPHTLYASYVDSEPLVEGITEYF
jgi:hypothetical protein